MNSTKSNGRLEWIEPVLGLEVTLPPIGKIVRIEYRTVYKFGNSYHMHRPAAMRTAEDKNYMEIVGTPGKTVKIHLSKITAWAMIP